MPKVAESSLSSVYWSCEPPQETATAEETPGSSTADRRKLAAARTDGEILDLQWRGMGFMAWSPMTGE
jgi:hypothetical protein